MERARPLLHPVSLAAMAVLALNDHLLKQAWPGHVTGKISDVAGLVFFPLLLMALGLPRRLSVALTALGFAAVKAWPWANDIWNETFSLVYAAVGFADRAALMCDPTDLMAVPAVLVALWLSSTINEKSPSCPATNPC